MTEQITKMCLKTAKEIGFRIVTAESLTGGLISSMLTKVPGASEVLFGGFVVYTVEAKSGMLSISPALIEKYGVVSEEVARAMSVSALKKTAEILESEKLISVAVTGIAGPDCGASNLSVGTVCMSLSTYIKTKVIFSDSSTFHFTGDRNEIRHQTTENAIRQIIKILNENSKNGDNR